MAKVGRPPKVKEVDMPELVEKFRRYIEETEIPIIAEFAYQNDLNKTYMYEREEFSTLVKLCSTKKESVLEKGLLTNKYNASGAIFSLKQLGWKDRAEKIIFVDPKTLSEAELKKLVDNE